MNMKGGLCVATESISIMGSGQANNCARMDAASKMMGRDESR